MLGSHSGFVLAVFKGKCRYCVATQFASMYNFLCLYYTDVNCSSLDDPLNGHVELSNTTVGSTANYTCNQGYILSNGNSTRTCEANGVWSGSPPSCECE